MKRLYWENTYLFEHTATITEIGTDGTGTFLRLDETIFHPQGGGQPSDEGSIDGNRVLKLVDLREIHQINHYIESAQSFKVGDRVLLQIDGKKRLEYAALHTAGHVTGGVLRFDYDYKRVLGANHFPKQAKVEYELDGRCVPNRNELKNKIQELVKEGRKISESYDSQNRRIIQIEGICEEACSGTHVSSTLEIESESFEIRKIESKGGRLKVGYEARYQSLTKEPDDTHPTLIA